MQSVLVLEADSANDRLHLAATSSSDRCWPRRRRYGSAAGEQLEHLRQHVLHERDGLRARRQHPFVRRPTLVRRQSAQLVRIQSQHRVRHDGSAGVRGHLDLRHQGDVPRRSVADQVTDVVLGVVPAAVPSGSPVSAAERR